MLADRLAPVHPGEFLVEDFLKPLGLSQYRLARALGVSPMRVSEIARGRRAVTPETAIRLGAALGTTPDYWLKLQARYDLDVARDLMDDGAVAAVERLVA